MLIQYNFGCIKVGESSNVIFQLKNTGIYSLIIRHVSASCGCTTVDWGKQPTQPGEITQIKVEIKPEEEGYFNKIIDVNCNIEGSSIKLTINGTANKQKDIM
jgi:hypothetical protein